MENSLILLKQYSDDRRKLIEFLLSYSNSINHQQVDFECISVDYIIDCIKNGGELDLSEASNKFTDESRFPATINSLSGSSYFLCSDPESSGSPPLRPPPQIELESKNDPSLHSSNLFDSLPSEKATSSVDEDGFRYTCDADGPAKFVQDENVLSLGLPILATGLSIDDLRETAYELLLTSMAFSGWQLHSFEEKKIEKKSGLLSRLKSRREREKIDSPSQTTEGPYKLLEVIRVQMQVSEAVDSFIRQRIMQFALGRSCEQFDLPYILLELLNAICKDDFPNKKSYIHWRKRQASILEELLFHSASFTTAEHLSIRSSIALIRNMEEWGVGVPPSECANVLLDIRNFSLKLLSSPGKFGIPHETYYWTSAYFLNIRLYEALLSSAFDILDEGQLVEEADTLLGLIKLTWTSLGITQKMHDALYAWVLFRQFVETGETTLLDNVILEIQKVLSSEGDDDNERAYMKSIICLIKFNDREASVPFSDAVCLSMSAWCNTKLQEYHRTFSRKAINFERVLTLLFVVGIPSDDKSSDIKLIKADAGTEFACRYLNGCIKKSILAACRQVNHVMDALNKPKAKKRHPLAELADELKLIAERESTVFHPVLCRWYPEAGMISSVTLHKFYGKKLKPFLDGVTSLSEDARSVLPAAYMLDHILMKLYYTTWGGEKLHSPCSKGLVPYQIREVSGPIILDWVNGQCMNIMEWTQRAFDLEDWEPLSSHQRHAASIVEVFRILEETIDQFFSLKLPMDVMHLQHLLSLICRSLEAYLLKMVNQLVGKSYMFPAVPALTRYEETMIPIVKKKCIHSMFLEDEVLNKLKKLTVSKLCVRLNTLEYIQHQIGALEDGIKNSWAFVISNFNEISKGEQFLPFQVDGPSKCGESDNELFTTMNTIREFAISGIKTICDFIGARVIFWDLRDTFLFKLYSGNVEIARLESCLQDLDSVLDHICSIVCDSLRELVVLSICQTSMDGYVWVLLDGGPSRAFSDRDIQFMREDLSILKEFFVADGEGLPPLVVDEEAKLAQQVLDLYSLESETVIAMLMSASEQVSSKSGHENPGGWCVEDANTLLRVLCHKKDADASKFLKRHYELPKSSEYEDTALKETAGSPAVISDMLKRTTSVRWTKKGGRSFKMIKTKFQEATSEIMHGV